MSYQYGDRVIVVLYSAIEVNKMLCFTFCFVVVAHNVHTARSPPFNVSGRLLSFWVSHPLDPGVEIMPKAGECAVSNYTIIAIDFASHYCVSRGNSGSPPPSSGQTDVGSPIY